MSIDWSSFDSKYVKLEPDRKKVLLVTNWRMGENKYDNEPAKPALVFDVLSEDGRDVMKEFKVSAFGLVTKLRPIVEDCDNHDEQSFLVAVTKVGKGSSTNYVVEKL
jgi:hypothetical protein